MRGKIFILDDDKHNVEYLQAILKREYYEVIGSTNVDEFYQKLENDSPDLFLMDIILTEDVDGYQICKDLKKRDEYHNIPLLFISGLENYDDIVKGFEAGGVDYIRKPFNKEELLARIKTHLQLKNLRSRLLTKIEENESLLRVLSHDLANQLGSIIGFSEIGNLIANDNEKRYFNNILTVANSSKDLITHIRKMIAIESGKQTVELEAFSVNELLKNTKMIFAKKLENKDLDLVYIPENFSDTLQIWVEPISFVNSVFNNLISNAIKFSYPDSEIKVIIEELSDKVKLTVKDKGTGIKEQHLRKLFSTTEQTSKMGTNGEIGTGFGMPLVKKYLDKFNAKITIESKHIDEFKDDHGTSIHLLLNKVEHNEQT